MSREDAKVAFEPSDVPGRQEQRGAGALRGDKASKEAGNYFGRHWRGGLSLGVSVWVNGLLALYSLPLLSLVQAAVPTAWYELPGAIRLVAAVWTLSIGIWVVLQIWSSVGIW